MQTFEELRAESKKLEQYIKRERYKNNKNEVENAIKTNNITLEDVKHLFATRVMPKTRDRCAWVLKHIGVPYYDEYLICRKTNGACTDAYNWIRLDDRKELKYEDVKMRD